MYVCVYIHTHTFQVFYSFLNLRLLSFFFAFLFSLFLLYFSFFLESALLLTATCSLSAGLSPPPAGAVGKTYPCSYA